MKLIYAMVFAVLLAPAMSIAGDIAFPFCEYYEDNSEPISRQHRYVGRLDVLSCRMHYRVYEIPWLYMYEEGKVLREFADTYRESIKTLLACTQFDYENTNEDRVAACYKEMDASYLAMFKLSDMIEWNKNIFTDDGFDVMVHNRRGLDLIIGQTRYVRPTRSWYDFGRYDM